MQAARIHEDDDYGSLLLAESLLEECLQENMELLRRFKPLEDSSQPKLSRAKRMLNAILSRGRLTPRYVNEALLLMAKVHYVQGRFRDAQGMCARVGLEELTKDEQPAYHLRLLAEAFVIKGLSLGHQSVTGVSRVRLSEREEESLSCFLKACDAALSFLQELDKVRLRAGRFCLKRKSRFFKEKFDTSVLCSNVVLMLCVQSAARKLAEVLLSSVSEDSYWSPLGPPPSTWLHREGAAASKDTSAEGVISRMPDQAEARQASLQDASSVYDLLTIGMARRGQYGMLSECLERAMKFSFNEFHLWHQLGLSLMAAGKGVAAVSVFKECFRMRPEDPSLPLLAAKICIGQLHWFEEAMSLSQGVISMGEEAGEFLPKAYLALGLCCSLRATEGNRNNNTAHSLDPQDSQIAMYLALQLALVRQVSAAMEPLQLALALCGDDLHSLHLLALLLSAQKHHRHALDTVALGLTQHPDNFNLLFTKVKLEEALLGPAVALQTCEDMLQRWQNRYDTCRSRSLPERPEASPVPSLWKPSSLLLTLPDYQDGSTGSQSPSSVAVSRLDAALSEISDMSSTRRQGPTYIWTTLERIWLQAAELFMADGRLKEAQFCIAEASTLFPNSHSLLLQRGRLAELRGQMEEAKSLYDEALAIHPTGEKILVQLGRLLVRTDRAHLGEKVLRDAVQVHSTSHEAWGGLGEALQSRDSSQAPDCFFTALELEASSPIRAFTIIPGSCETLVRRPLHAD
uniref:Tetratricopeptide repeat domain 7A n=1 Tax=Neogobius melanostomus TaxID=47308 RepID=A0A8C6UQL3_9GOBI